MTLDQQLAAAGISQDMFASIFKNDQAKDAQLCELCGKRHAPRKDGLCPLQEDE